MTPEADRASGVRIEAAVQECINYASWQNSVPLLRSLMLRNDSGQTLKDLKLTLETSPRFTRLKQWHVDELNGIPLPINDREIELDPDYLNGLNEAERAEVTLKLTANGKLLAESVRPIRVLARDEWGGVDPMGSLLAAFVMPNDPAVSKVLKTASKLVWKDHGQPSGLDGYQSGDPSRAFLLVAAIWSADCGRGIVVRQSASAASSSTGQKIRRAVRS